MPNSNNNQLIMRDLISKLANHLGLGRSTLYKWIRQLSPNKNRRRELTAEQQRIMALEK
ncbi:hypothetical protein [Gilliamella sp. Pas-s27]|uniref:hypothetical protein n=1 Tax=Gilliamella sp. Pas-s27 TaxID=2687311 RepID=UPI00136602F9|nr:hypothetical protein [Gilliamella sp. Pas-s27]MWP46069.1 hypothetical protein [Gilliamella sp. Pas-s27]